MSGSIFADTSGLANLIDSKQPHHQLALKILGNVRMGGRRLVLTNYILAELVATLTNPLRLPSTKVVNLLDDLRASSLFQIVHVDEQLDFRGYDLLKSRQDKEWSLVDCVSFSLMSHLGMTEALTTDRHFEQAGFVRLLK